MTLLSIVFFLSFNQKIKNGMKNNFSFKKVTLIFVAFFIGFAATAQLSPKEKKVIYDSRSAKSAFIKADPSMRQMFKKAYGYAIFPKVGKGGAVIGAAFGNGAVSENGKAVGMAKMSQVTIGPQLGGQSYREVIFFEKKSDLDRFKDDKFEFSAQVSAVAVKSGASSDAKYTDGVVIFTQTRGGLMAEASVGGQKFKYKKFWIRPLF
jgi:lipid-binding SYLF domain-containing protein